MRNKMARCQRRGVGAQYLGVISLSQSAMFKKFLETKCQRPASNEKSTRRFFWRITSTDLEAENTDLNDLQKCQGGIDMIKCP